MRIDLARGESGLTWEPIGLDDKLTAILEAVKSTEVETPKQNTRTLRKLGRWQEQLTDVIETLDRIRNDLAPKLDNELDIPLKANELLQVAMFQPSTKNLFSELEIHFSSSDRGPLEKQDYTVLGSLSEMAKSLALVGDAAISMAVLHHIWQPKATDVGTLTQRRSDLVSNEHLAGVCDDWGLYEHRIHFDPVEPSKSEIEHDKGTLVEAIYGIVYIEHGFQRVKDLVPKLVQ
ncbi:MAG: ribonuclease III domain-containing protein [Candidatus Thorarchaeota archaeon]